MGLDENQWRTMLARRRVVSDNYDTIVALDFPHYCSGATLGCGGPKGWCYTFQGRQASADHHDKSMMVGTLAERFPALFAEVVAEEINDCVRKGSISSPNVRVSGSGELHQRHVEALVLLHAHGVHVWGYTKVIEIAVALRRGGIDLLFSCDASSDSQVIEHARALGFGLAYTSLGVTDRPPYPAVVTFPLHRGGRVKEVVSDAQLCPKVVEEYFSNHRVRGWCQTGCRRCHLKG